MHASMRSALVALVAILALTACQADESDESDEQTDDGAADLDLQEAPEPDDPVDLDEGLAAVVEGTEITRDRVESRFEAISAVPQVSEQLEGEEGEAAAGLYRARVLQNLIIGQVVADGAREMGVEPSPDDVVAAEQEAVEQFDGGREEWEQMLEEQGITDEQRQEEFLFVARINAIRDRVAEDLDESELEMGEELDLAPEDLALQQWLGEQLAETEVQVDQEYGLWNPDTGEVVPAGLAENSG